MFFLQNSFDNPSRETSIVDDIRELQRLVSVYSGENCLDVAKDYIDLEKAVEEGYSIEMQQTYGYPSNGGLSDEYGNDGGSVVCCVCR